MEAAIIKLECITNMHVGNGDVNYNIIDNEVERDSITGYPVIHSSGVKGALRDYFVKNKLDGIREIFGTGNGEGGTSEGGKVKILGAEMVAIPARASQGDRPYYLVTTDAAVKRINELSNLFIKKDLVKPGKNPDATVKVEGYSGKKQKIMGGKEFYCLKEKEFKNISLPVLARNKLNDGISVNLWYEEVVPHQSIFIFPVVSEDKKLLKTFTDAIDQKIVQFGGNASIGYGLCQISVIGKDN